MENLLLGLAVVIVVVLVLRQIRLPVLFSSTTTAFPTTMTTAEMSGSPIDNELDQLSQIVLAPPPSMKSQTKAAVVATNPISVTGVPVKSQKHAKHCGCSVCAMAVHHRHNRVTPICASVQGTDRLSSVNFAPYDAWNSKPCPNWKFPIARYHLQRPWLTESPIDWNLVPGTEHQHWRKRKHHHHHRPHHHWMV